ncbi:MAG: protein jag [Dehalococcoidales bacterium]|nr:MAG: protein jag [Dehalococcoidales bacterium]
MESLEVSARTVEEAIQLALDQLGVDREEVEVSVVKEGKPGILGLGADQAVVRVTPLVSTAEPASDVAGTAKDALERLIDLMGVAGSVTPQEPPDMQEELGITTSVFFDIRGDDLGILIGRRGQTLTSLQYILRLIVGHQTKVWEPIFIDVEGYKQRRYQGLQNLARNMAEQAEAKGVPFTLEPMSAYERRIVHLALAEHPRVTTESIGQGEARRVVIIPRK